MEFNLFKKFHGRQAASNLPACLRLPSGASEVYRDKRDVIDKICLQSDLKCTYQMVLDKTYFNIIDMIFKSDTVLLRRIGRAAHLPLSHQ